MYKDSEENVVMVVFKSFFTCFLLQLVRVGAPSDLLSLCVVATRVSNQGASP